MRNAEIALHFDELADLYELDGAIVHRVLAYRNAAKAIRESTASIEEMTRAGTVTQVPGIGKTLEEKLNALFDTGTIPSAEKLKAKYPPGLVEITRLPGFGAKAEESVRAALEAGVQSKERMLLSKALEVADALVSAIRENPAADRVELAGSARRWAETCKDIDIVATATDPEALADAFAKLPLLGDVSRQGSACATDDEVYELLGMHPIPPELREDRGEIETALHRDFDWLITREQLRGDL